MDFPTDTLPRHPLPGRPEDAWGRLHIERNGFFYTGLILDITTQRNSVMVYVSMTDKRFSLDSRGGALESIEAALVPAGHIHVRGVTTSVAVLDVCPTDRGFRALARAAATAQAWPRAHFEPIMEDLEAFRSGRMHRIEAGQLHARFLELALQRVPPVPPTDTRVRLVMRLLRDDPDAPVADLAKAVGMSVDWLRHLFVTEACIPIHKYTMTLKLQAAAVHLKRGLSLSDVAARAGFADLAHFSKVWKLHYGFAPRRAFHGEEVSIDPTPQPSCFDTSRPTVEVPPVPGARIAE